MTHNNMNKEKLTIIPYIANHGKLIMQSQMNHSKTQADSYFIGECQNLEQEGLAFTGLINDKIIASAGMKKLWKGVAEGWVLATYDIWNYPTVTARAIKKNFEILAKENNLTRIQTAVRADFGIGIRFAKWLGLENEGLMKKYGHDGTDHYRFARLF